MFDLVYFSSTSENTKRFVEKLKLNAHRIPLKSQEAEHFVCETDNVLVVPTYGGGEDKAAVPKQVIKFLNNPKNRKHVKGVIATGNTNFGDAYCIAGEIVASKLEVPLIARVEILGTPNDIQEVTERLERLWQLN